MTYNEFYNEHRHSSDPPFSGFEPVWIVTDLCGVRHRWLEPPGKYGVRGKIKMYTFREYIDLLWKEREED